MKHDFSIRLARSTEDIQSVRQLFQQYADSLALDLDYQGFEEEAAKLPGKYAAPVGCLLLASDFDGAPIGCAGLRPLEQIKCCEMKRLYVLPSARGLGLGRSLALILVRKASRLGYHRLYLDTLASMSEAIALYKRLGFERTSAYYGPVPADTIFMQLDLLNAGSLTPAPSPRAPIIRAQPGEAIPVGDGDPER